MYNSHECMGVNVECIMLHLVPHILYEEAKPQLVYKKKERSNIFSSHCPCPCSDYVLSRGGWNLVILHKQLSFVRDETHSVDTARCALDRPLWHFINRVDLSIWASMAVSMITSFT